LEERESKDKKYREEIVCLNDKVKGKDLAIKHLSETIM
jgi:hypothetical protein